MSLRLLIGLVALLAMIFSAARIRYRAAWEARAIRDLFVRCPPVADQFFGAFRAGRFEEAYRMTSEAYRREVDLPHFRALGEHPTLKRPLGQVFGGAVDTTGGGMTYFTQWQLTNSSSFGRVRVYVVIERGEPRISNLQIEGYYPPGP